MGLLRLVIVSCFAVSCLTQSSSVKTEGTLLTSVLMPVADNQEKLLRQERSYYDQRYGVGTPYDRLEYPKYSDYRPYRCGRCLDDRDDGYDRPRDRYDDDRRQYNKPTYGNRFDRNKNEKEDDDRYNMDKHNEQNNGTEKENDDKKLSYDDKDDKENRPSGSGRNRDRDRDRYDDRGRYDGRYGDRDRYAGRDRYGGSDRYRSDYYDRFARDPYRTYDRGYYDDIYSRERRPLFDRSSYSDRFGDDFAGRYDGVTYRNQIYDDRYDRGSGYDIYGGYGPGLGRGAHDSFRPWDETYRGQAGWDAGGRGYYFASGRPDSAPATTWGRPEYARPDSGWQNGGYSSGYQDQFQYRGYPQDSGYRQDLNSAYGKLSGWHSVSERRAYRDQSGVNQLDNRGSVFANQGYVQSLDRGQQPNYGQSTPYDQNYRYNLVHRGFGETTSTTQATGYLYQRDDQQVTAKPEEGDKKADS